MKKYEVYIRHHSRDGEPTNVIIPVEASHFELLETKELGGNGHSLLFWGDGTRGPGTARVAAFSFWNHVLEVKEWTIQK